MAEWQEFGKEELRPDGRFIIVNVVSKNQQTFYVFDVDWDIIDLKKIKK